MINSNTFPHKQVYDYANPINLHETFERDTLFVELASTRAFQRLKEIRFLGGIDYYLIPNPNGEKSNSRYTRYQHSLGVAKLALLYADKKELDEKERLLIYASALLHDIGHAPLSHTMEPVFEEVFNINHHVVSNEIIIGTEGFGSEISSTLRKFNVDPDQVVEVLNGKSSFFDGFFSGPINFDTIEGVLRARQYIKTDVMRLNPESVLMAALERDKENSSAIVDSFWHCKHEIYNLMIRSKDGVLIDYACQHEAKQELEKLTKRDFLTTESKLFKKIPRILKVLKASRKHNALTYFLKSPITYQSRKFYIDREFSFESYNDVNRYRQIKEQRTLKCSL